MFAAESSHTTYPGSPVGSMSNASPSMVPVWFVNRHELTVVPVAVTLYAGPTPVDVAKELFVNVLAGFCVITVPPTVSAVPEF